MEKSEINNVPRKRPLKMLGDFFNKGFKEFFEKHEKRWSRKKKLTVFWIIMTLYVLMLAYLAYDLFSPASEPIKTQSAFPSIVQEKKDAPLQASPEDSENNLPPKEEKTDKKKFSPLPEK